MWIFDAPLYLALLLLLPLLLYLRYGWKGRGGTVLLSFSLWRGERFIPQSRLPQLLLFLSRSAFWGGLILVILGLAGPTYVEREKVFLSRGTDVVFVLDESPSMAARDFQPGNRFESAKDVIRRFVLRRENDPVGLVTFGSEALLRIPPTLDYDYFLRTLEEVRLMTLGEGTAIGLGLAVAALHLENSSAQNKAVVLITDGDNNAGEIQPQAAAEIAAQLGIKVYPVGIGSRGEVTVEYRDPDTGKLVGGRYRSDFNEELLRRVAEATGGRYFEVQSYGMLNAVLETIDSLESHENIYRIKTRSRRYFREFLLAGLLLFCLDFYLRKGLLKEVL